MTIYRSAIVFRAELKEWRLEHRRLGSTRVLTVYGRIYGDTKGFYKDGTLVAFSNVTDAEYRGRHVIGQGKGRAREYFKAYDLTRKE